MYYTYNLVISDKSDVCPKGELITDCALKRLQKSHKRHIIPETVRVRLPRELCCYIFGTRQCVDYWAVNRLLRFIGSENYEPGGTFRITTTGHVSYDLNGRTYHIESWQN